MMNRKTEFEMDQVDPSLEPLSVQKNQVEELYYKIDQVPPWYICLFLGFQNYLTMFGSTLAFCFIVIPKFCIPDDHIARGYVISTSFFIGGFATILQASIGTRLPIIQGSAFAFMVPVLTILNLPHWRCPSIISLSEVDNVSNMTINESMVANDEIWMSRIQEIQGAIIIGALIETLIGLTGLVGLLLQFVSPLTIAPVVCLVSLGLFNEASSAASTNWPIAFMTTVLLVLFSQYFGKVLVPIYYFTWRKKISVKKISLPMFQLFPVLTSVLIAWGVCAILTATNSVDSDSPIKTDTNWIMVSKSAWFRVPYPGQWGWPTFSVSSVLGVVGGVLSSIMESVGDYHCCGRLVGHPIVPSHAINRGIMVEGLASVFGGLFGTGSGVTSYTENVATIGITKVGSRRVIVYAGGCMIAMGLISKIGNFFMTMPTPILGGLFFVAFSMVSGVGLSSLQHVNLNSTRNLFILGASLFSGLCFPQYMKTTTDLIKTGSDVVDQILTVLLSTGLFMAAFVGIFLDNTIPGNLEDRGITKWRKKDFMVEGSQRDDSCYGFPRISGFLEKHTWLQLLPISPTYVEGLLFKKIFKRK